MTTRAATLASLVLLMGVGGAFSQTPTAASPAARAPRILVADVDTPIHPAAANYLKKVLRSANEEGAALVIVELSTPGGLLTSTREMTSAILRSKVPVVTYVAPSGAQSASAGFFILLSGDIAAMAPGTNAGAAHPVGGEGQDLPKTINEKAEQDARAYIRSLARERGRNAEKAEAAVAKSVSYTETEAKQAGLIEVIARDEPDLVKQLEGRAVKRLDGSTAVLKLAGAKTERREMSRAEKLIGIVSHPNVAYLLFLAGLMGIYFELSSPGAVLPGVVGGIALLLALYAFSVLPVNLAGLALIIFAIILFIAEVKVVSHGVLAVGGAVALIAGSLLLFSGRGEETLYRIDVSIIVPALLLTLAVVGILTWKTLEIRMRPARTGQEGMVGQMARVVEVLSPGTGKVFLHGEYWDADGPPGLAPGEEVRIAGVNGLRLRVERRN